MIEFPGAYGGKVIMTFDAASQKSPDSVLVIATMDDGILMTYNPARGWEPPGGKIEAGETPLDAAIRETYEETGACLEAVEWLAQYEVLGGKPDYICKWVFCARIKELRDRPAGFETTASKLFSPWPSPEEIAKNPGFSPLVRDRVYASLLKHIADGTKTRSPH